MDRFTSVVSVKAYLSTQIEHGFFADDPVFLPMNINLGDMSQEGSGWHDLLAVIDFAGKYVSLDLEPCLMSGTRFGGDWPKTGKNKIVSIVLPNAATTMLSFNSISILAQIEGMYISTIDNNAFSNCIALKNVNFPAATEIGRDAFSNCIALKNVSFPAAASIREHAFYCCTALESISFPAAASIREHAFYCCTALKSVSFPASASLDSEPFYDCPLLASIDIMGSGRLSVIEAGKILVKDNSVLVAYPSASGSITVDSVRSIGESAFSGCAALKCVSFPAVSSIGEGAFSGCTALESVNFPAATEICNSAFYRCTALTNVNFPAVTEICNSAFYRCTALTNVNFPAVNSIGRYAFSGCTALKNMSFPTLNSIGRYAFNSTGNMALTISMGKSAPEADIDLFYNISNGKIITVRVPIDAEGYVPTGTAIPAAYSGTNAAVCWGNGFRGRAWNGTGFTSSNVNNYITLNIEYQ